MDPGVLSLCYAAFSLFCLGYPDQARQRSEEALALARRLTHSFTTALALTWAATVCHGRREAEAARQHAEVLVALAQEQEFPYWVGFGLLLRGAALAVQGDGTAGSEQIRQGLMVLQATGTVVGLRFGATLLTEVYVRDGKVEEGLATVNEVLRTLDQPGERLWDAELYRLKGALLLAQESALKSQKSKVKVQKSKVTDPRSLNPEPTAVKMSIGCNILIYQHNWMGQKETMFGDSKI